MQAVLVLYKITNTHLFTNSHSNFVFALLRLTGVGSSLAQTMTLQQFEVTFLNILSFFQSFEAIFLEPKTKKVEKAIRALR